VVVSRGAFETIKPNPRDCLLTSGSRKNMTNSTTRCE
jgi:hypothetical protein